MWTTSEPYYTKKSKLKMLKSATTEQLIEYLLMITGSEKK